LNAVINYIVILGHVNIYEQYKKCTHIFGQKTSWEETVWKTLESNIKISSEKSVQECELDSVGSGYGPLTHFFEVGGTSLNSIKVGSFSTFQRRLYHIVGLHLVPAWIKKPFVTCLP
jgi:hypothetical protein